MIGLSYGNFASSGVSGFTGLLDTYPNAAAAYSLRLLKSDYTGALVEIRRSSDNAVKTFYADSNNELSLTSEDGSGTSLSSWITTDNGFVRTWYDQSGNANNATQTTASNQPKIVNSGVLVTVNSKAGIDFSASDFISLENTTLSFAQPYTSSVVVYYNAVAKDKYIFSQKSGSVTRGDIGKANSTNKFFMHSGSNSGAVGSLLTTRQYQVLGLHNGASSELSINGSNTTGLSVGTNSKDGLTVGNFKSPSAFSYNWEAPIQELIFWDSNQSANRTGIETNQNDHYSIY
jgi:hypothetical protein